MRALKLLFFIGVCLCTNGLYAQKATPQFIEADLVRKFKKIDYWNTEILNQRDKGNTDNVVKLQDSLEKANQIFETKLKAYSSQYLFTITQNFNTLANQGLSIATSEDNLLRIYSWDTWLGGTMHDFSNVFQYKTFNKTKLFEPKHIDGEGTCYYEKIYTLKIGNATYYLATYSIIASTKDLGGGIQVFSIDNGILNNDVKIIKTKTGLHSRLYYDYDLFNSRDWKAYPKIFFDNVSQTIKIPLIASNGRATHKFITYKFTGEYFEKNK